MRAENGQTSDDREGEYYTELASEQDHDESVMTSSQVHARVLQGRLQVPEILSWPSSDVVPLIPAYCLFSVKPPAPRKEPMNRQKTSCRSAIE